MEATAEAPSIHAHVKNTRAGPGPSIWFFHEPRRVEGQCKAAKVSLKRKKNRVADLAEPRALASKAERPATAPPGWKPRWRVR